jgi:hypothetical protein
MLRKQFRCERNVDLLFVVLEVALVAAVVVPVGYMTWGASWNSHLDGSMADCKVIVGSGGWNSYNEVVLLLEKRNFLTFHGHVDGELALQLHLNMFGLQGVVVEGILETDVPHSSKLVFLLGNIHLLCFSD